MMSAARKLDQKRSTAILDCNVWIDLLAGNDGLEREIVDGARPIIITSYIAVEILHALRHVARDLGIAASELEGRFWDTCMLPSIEKLFEQSLSGSVINEIKMMPEMRIIARLLDMEIKDMPYIVVAFQHRAILVTKDVRSIYAKRGDIKTRLGVIVQSEAEFLGTLDSSGRLDARTG
jgi:predicted nucleic acid-binding protein